MGHDWKHECRYRKKDGAFIWVEVKGKPVRNEDSVITSYQTITRDITERKQAELLVKESEENYRMLFESINDAVFISELSADGKSTKFIQVNDVACQRYGYTKEELLTLSSFDINSEESKKNIPSIINTLLENKHVIVEAEHKIKDGRDIPVEISSRISELKDKTIIHSLVRDITERKATEKLLKENEEKYRLITEKITDVVWIMDITGKSLFVSQICKLFFRIYC